MKLIKRAKEKGLEIEGKEWTLKERFEKDEVFRQGQIDNKRSIEDMENMQMIGTQGGKNLPMPYQERMEKFKGKAYVVTQQTDPEGGGTTIPRRSSEGYKEAMSEMRSHTRPLCNNCYGEMKWISTAMEPWSQCNKCFNYLGVHHTHTVNALCVGCISCAQTAQNHSFPPTTTKTNRLRRG